MPKNTTGGKHKGRKNGEGNTAKKNRTLVEAFISDIRSEGDCEQVYVGRVTQRLGDGRMSVFFMNDEIDRKNVPTVINAPIKGALRGKKGKAQARIEVGSIVMINNTGLGGSHAYEIIAVMTNEQVEMLRDEMDLDPRILAKDIVDTDALKKESVGIDFEFDYAKKQDEDINIDEI